MDPVTVIVSVLVPMMVRVVDPEEVGVFVIDTEPVIVRVAVVVRVPRPVDECDLEIGAVLVVLTL